MPARGVTMNHEMSYWAGHAMSAIAVLGTLAGYLPAIAAIAGLVWYSIQIWESRTVREWKVRRHERRVAALKAKLMIAEQKVIKNPVTSKPVG